MGIVHAEVFDSGYCKGHGRRADIGVYRIKNQMVLLLMTSLHEIFFSHRINWDIFCKVQLFLWDSTRKPSEPSPGTSVLGIWKSPGSLLILSNRFPRNKKTKGIHVHLVLHYFTFIQLLRYPLYVNSEPSLWHFREIKIIFLIKDAFCRQYHPFVCCILILCYASLFPEKMSKCTESYYV